MKPASLIKTIPVEYKEMGGGGYNQTDYIVPMYKLII